MLKKIKLFISLTQLLRKEEIYKKEKKKEKKKKKRKKKGTNKQTPKKQPMTAVTQSPVCAASLIVANDLTGSLVLQPDEIIELEKGMQISQLPHQSISDDKGRKFDVCRHWARGFCNRGVACGFAHIGPSPLIEKKDDGKETKSLISCKDFSAGKCNRGDRCKFAHVGTGPRRGTPTCRDWAAGTCNRGDSCKYVHEGMKGSGHNRLAPSPSTSDISPPPPPTVIQVPTGPIVLRTEGTAQDIWAPHVVVHQPVTIDNKLVYAEQMASRLRAQAAAAEVELANLRIQKVCIFLFFFKLFI